MIETYIYLNFLERRKFRKLSLGFIITTPRKTPKNQQFWSEIKKNSSEQRKCMQPAYYWAWYFLRGPFQKMENLHFTAPFYIH